MDGCMTAAMAMAVAVAALAMAAVAVAAAAAVAVVVAVSVDLVVAGWGIWSLTAWDIACQKFQGLGPKLKSVMLTC